MKKNQLEKKSKHREAKTMIPKKKKKKNSLVGGPEDKVSII